MSQSIPAVLRSCFYRVRLHLLLGITVFCLCLMFSCAAPPEKACVSDSVCAKDEICEGGRCINGCRFGYQCPPEHICDKSTRQCTQQLCKPGTKRECYDGPANSKEQGTCAGGYQWCHETGSGWSPCYEQRIPSPEACDSRDNNCNGKVDEDLRCDCEPSTSRRCYTGPTETLGVGLCDKGIQYCTKDRVWGPCLEQKLPTREICDGLDNDCNGQVDDQIDCECQPGTSRDCYSGPDTTVSVGRCKKGKQSCGPNSRWGICFAQQMPQLEEIELCNNKDDNCDGFVDNVSGSQEPLKELCYNAAPNTLRKGPCQQGLRTCKGGVWSSCEGEVTPKVEECNNKDDDCNGLIDDNVSTRSCASTNSGCQKQTNGSFRCQGICNTGAQRCTAGKWSSCEGEVLPTATEICGNQKDDDCNGLLDDNCECEAGKSRACYTKQPATSRGVGECKDGTQTCLHGKWTECQGDIGPKIETCNGKDDNCDGQVDNLDMPACTIPGQSGVCGAGKWVCQNDKPACVAAVGKSTEICNDKDDDCDGQVDNIADLGKPCTDPLRQGICAAGQWACEKSNKICKQTIQARKQELCDGKDDDCDGQVDNIQGSCVIAGQQGVCSVGAWTCENGKQVCKSQKTASSESCNLQDDDCNGIIDDIKDLRQACKDPTRFGPCEAGVWVCENNKKICKALQQPQAEICNQQDDDCDGNIDNGLPGCKSCKTSADCAAGRLCLQGNCVVAECLQTSDCSGGKLCKALKCVYCQSSLDCASMQYCDKSQTPSLCKPYECQVNSDCPFGKLCDLTTRKCASCQKDADCPTQSICDAGVCYKACQSDNHCASTEKCQTVTRAGNPSQRCYPKCQADSDCPQGFACHENLCAVTLALDNRAYQWSDGSVGSSCTAYRYPPEGYKPSRQGGAFWVQPDPNQKTKVRVYCDMQMDEGGWMLLARYSSKLLLKNFDPTQHQLQDTSGGQTSANPVDLISGTQHGHLAYNLFPIKGRELMIRCKGSGQNDWYTVTRDNLFENWDPGAKGAVNASSWGYLAYVQNGKVFSRKDNGLCGANDDTQTSALRGISYCSGGASTVNNHLVSLGFHPTTGKLEIVCNKKSLTDGEGEIWVRDLGTNPLVMDASGTRSWKDGTYAETCRAYRRSIGGQYTGATGSGAYWIKTSTSGTRFKVYCDMELDLAGEIGGWTLIGRYSPRRDFEAFHPHRHQLQDGSKSGKEVTQPPDLISDSTYGHIDYRWFPIQSRQLLFRCRKGSSWSYTLRGSKMTDWSLGRNPDPSKGAGEWFTIHSYNNAFPVGLANGGATDYCTSGSNNYRTHAKRYGFMLCNRIYPYYVAGIEPNRTKYPGGLFMYCGQNAIHYKNPKDTPPYYAGYLYIR